MPEVNLLKDTENLPTAGKKPVVPGTPELSKPSAAPAGPGFGGVFKSLFNRAPKPLPTTPIKPAANALGTMGTRRSSGASERILSETKHAPRGVVPLPEDDDENYSVNLLTEDLVSTVNYRQRGMMLGGVALGVALLFVGGYFAISIYQQRIASQVTDTEAQLAAVKAEIVQLNKQQQQAGQAVQKLTAIRTLIDRHARWTKFFGLIEKYTLPSVTYGSAFSGDLNGSLSLSATTQTYEQVAQQYLVFQQLVAGKTLISSFTVTGATRTATKDGGSQVSFTVSMKLLPEVFTVSASDALNESSTTTQPTS